MLPILKIIFIQAFIYLTIGQEWYQRNNPIFLDYHTIGPTMLHANEIKIILYIKPECDECMILKQKFDQFITTVKRVGRQDIKLYYIDCLKEKNLCEEMKVIILPFVILFNKSGRTEEEFATTLYTPDGAVDELRKAINVIDNRGNAQREYLTNHMRKQQKKVNKQTSKIENKPNQEVEKVNLDLGNQKKQEKPIKQKPKKQQSQKNIPTIIINPTANSITQNNNHQFSQQTRQKIIQDLSKRRQNKKKSTLSKSISSILSLTILICFIIGAGVYVKNILSHSVAIKKIMIGNKVYLSKPVEEQQRQKLVQQSKSSKNIDVTHVQKQNKN